MDLRKLEFFESVARLGNFTKAAEELHVSQPTITMAIQSLEQSLKVKLLTRTQREVTLTTEGEILYQKAVQILHDVKNAMELMKDLGETPNTVISIGITPIIGADIYHLLIDGFKKKYPQVKFHIIETGSHGVLEELINGTIELGYIVFTQNIDSRFKTEQVVSGEVNILMNKDNEISNYDRVPFKKMAEQNIIQLPTHSFLRREIDKIYIAKGVKPKYIIEPTQMITNYELVATGLGISFILNPKIKMVKENKLLVTRPLEIPLCYKSGFVWRSDTYLSDISKKMVDFVVENTKNNS